MTDNETTYDWVGDWAARRASLSPDQVAIIDVTADSSYTYGDLEMRANRTARLLTAHGVTDGERVAVVSRNRIEPFDLFFGTGKTGGVLAPLSHRLAPPELATLLEVIDPRLLVVESPFRERLEEALTQTDSSVDPTVIELEEGEIVETETETLESHTRSLEDPHLLLHTGGSTGTPKVTTITHGSIYWNSINTITAWGLRAEDVTPMVFPTFHTGGWNVLSIPLLHMGGTILLEREVDPGSILEQIETHRATILVAVPTVLRSMARHDNWVETDLSSLRFVKSGGGPCRESIIRAWRERGVDFSQGYGLTEIGPNNFAMPEEYPPEKVASVGKPVLHTDARIVDVDDPETRLETGEIGELELAGPHAASGYWGDEAATRETFGSGWVSTGDLARVDEDGFYYIVGRTKNMFVSGGENVYPPEVEDAIAEHPAVEDVVVIGVPDEQWGTVGKAVIQPADASNVGDTESQQPLTLAALETFLENRIARFKMPKSLEVVEELPTSGPSKIDRSAIEERFGTVSE